MSSRPRYTVLPNKLLILFNLLLVELNVLLQLTAQLVDSLTLEFRSRFPHF
jgi:hypothetical protein